MLVTIISVLVHLSLYFTSADAAVTSSAESRRPHLAQAEFQMPEQGKAELYVSPNGSDSGDGSASDPFRTIQKAASVATAGSTVHVSPGVYADIIQSRANGMAEAPIRFVSDLPGGAVVRPIGANGTIWVSFGDHVTIEGFEIDGSSSPAARVGIFMAGSNVYVRNNEVHHLVLDGANDGRGGAGIVLGGGNSKKSNQHAIGNEVHHVGTDTSDRVHGIYHQSTGSIVGNLVYTNPGSIGIVLWHDATDIVIANNTVFDNAVGISVGSGDWYQEQKPANNVKVVNNLVYDNRGAGIQEHGVTGRNNVYQNNLVYRNGRNWRLQNGLTHRGTITADPQFVNYQRGGAGDYRVRDASPAIGKGAAKLPRGGKDGLPRSPAQVPN